VDRGFSRCERLEAAITAATVIPVSEELVAIAAETRAACRRAGHPLADVAHANDLWAAATTISIGAALISADRIFEAVPGLGLYSRSD